MFDLYPLEYFLKHLLLSNKIKYFFWIKAADCCQNYPISQKKRRRAMLIPLAPCPKSLPMTWEAWTRWWACHHILRIAKRRINRFMQVRDLVEECQCASQFSMIRVSEGKYRIGDTKILIFVRVGIPLMESHEIFLKFHLVRSCGATWWWGWGVDGTPCRTTWTSMIPAVVEEVPSSSPLSSNPFLV